MTMSRMKMIQMMTMTIRMMKRRMTGMKMMTRKRTMKKRMKMTGGLFGVVGESATRLSLIRSYLYSWSWCLRAAYLQAGA